MSLTELGSFDAETLIGVIFVTTVLLGFGKSFLMISLREILLLRSKFFIMITLLFATAAQSGVVSGSAVIADIVVASASFIF